MPLLRKSWDYACHYVYYKLFVKLGNQDFWKPCKPAIRAVVSWWYPSVPVVLPPMLPWPQSAAWKSAEHRIPQLPAVSFPKRQLFSLRWMRCGSTLNNQLVNIVWPVEDSLWSWQMGKLVKLAVVALFSLLSTAFLDGCFLYPGITVKSCGIREVLLLLCPTSRLKITLLRWFQYQHPLITVSPLLQLLQIQILKNHLQFYIHLFIIMKILKLLRNGNLNHQINQKF